MVSKILNLFIALEHLGFLVLEMFLWTQPIGLRIFALTPEQASQSQALAMNQGLYNGFLAAGLIWSTLFFKNPQARSVQAFFLICVLIAGIFGGATAKTSILFVQALPALIALILLKTDKAASQA